MRGPAVTDVGKKDVEIRFLSAGYRVALYGAVTYAVLAILLVAIGHAINGPFMPLNGLFVLSAVFVAVIAGTMLLYRWVVWLRAIRTGEVSADGRSRPAS
jgi:hypothetical protein